MTAWFRAPIQAEIDRLISELADGQCRRRITDAWISGSLDGDRAMDLLVNLDLIERSPEAGDG